MIDNWQGPRPTSLPIQVWDEKRSVIDPCSGPLSLQEMDDNSPKLETHSLNIFPALIPFWFTIHGLPLHYWTDEAIGNDLGPVENFEVEKARIRVWVNGLRPLEMILDISLPSGEIKQVELEYKNLEKHCFICHYLSHDKDNCPSQQAQANTRFSGAQAMGISQNRTRDRLESDRRRQAEKKLARSDSLTNPWERKTQDLGSSPLTGKLLMVLIGRMIRTSALPMELGKIPTFSVTQPETLILLQEDTLPKKDFPLKR